ncbi:MAG TPA: ATP-dependent DNA helicase RecG [Rectinemataceae bacterium]|nr:ATP-dependent DNA helicase RecG [Rectinemataceae bacterium]
MFLRELRDPVTRLRGAGKTAAALLARMGIYSVADLLLHFPRDWDDRSSWTGFAESAKSGTRAHAKARVFAHEWFGYGRMKTLKLRVDDGRDEASLVCFNRSFLEKSVPVGSQVVVTGRFVLRYGELQSSSFEIEALDGDGDGRVKSGLLAVYPLTEGLAQGNVRKLVAQALAEYGSHVEGELPVRILSRRALMAKRDAIRAMHLPRDEAEAERARESLAFEELFFFQLAVAQRAHSRGEVAVVRKTHRGALRSRLEARLPWKLTGDQRKAVAEIVDDMGKTRPMARLLQGDVGSGKTLVAFFAALEAIESGGQAALMAPTELLARQHAETAASLLEPLGIRLAFLSGNVDDAARPPLLAAIAKGDVDFVLGTQALFSDGVVYRELRLAIVDEQHRFGVLQRLALSRKGPMPDLLMMTATPIPRTLALTVFGDLAVSTIREMPPGRKPIVTHLAKAGNEAKVYDFVGRALEAGQRAYFVYPLIGESAKLELKNAEAMFARLRDEIFPGIPAGLIHSRLREEEKRQAMSDFKRGETRILVATSVVEVGVDVPEATVMVIEHAERFGLAALHQLRGRVGRGGGQSWCFLVYSDRLTEEGKARLKAMLDTTDGFRLAEEDMKIRGPGELSGTAQSGALGFAVADPVRDLEILEKARAEAFALVEEDPALLSESSHPLREVLRRAPPFGEGVAVS